MHAQPLPFEGPRQPGNGMNPPNVHFAEPPPMGPGPMPRPMNQGGNGFHAPANNNQPQLHQKFGNMNLNDGPSRPSENMLKAYVGKSIGFRIRPHEEKRQKSGEPLKLNWARAEKNQMFFPQTDFDRLVDTTEPKGNVMGQQDNLDTSLQRKAVDQAVAEWREQETDRRFSWDLVCVVVKRLKNPPKTMMYTNKRDRPVREIRIVLQRVLAEPLPQTSMAGGKGKEGAQGGREGPNGGPDHAGGRPNQSMNLNNGNMGQANMGQGNMGHGGPPPMPQMNHGPPMMPPNHGPPPMHQSHGPPPMHMNNGPPPMNLNNGPPPMSMGNGPPPMNMGNGPPPMNMNSQNGFNRPPPPPPNFPPMPNGPMNGGPPFPRPPMNNMPPPGRPMSRLDEPAGIEVFDDDDEPPRMRGGPPPPGHGRRPPPIVTDHHHRDHRRRSPSRSRSRSRSRRSRRSHHRHRNDDDAYSRSSVYSSEDDIFSPHSPRSFGSPISSTHASLASSSRHRRRGGVLEYNRGKRGSPHSAVFVRRPSTSSKPYHGRGSAYGRASHSDFDHVSDDEELGYRRHHHRDHDRDRDFVRRRSPSASGSDRSRRRRHAERERRYRDDRLARDFERFEDDRRRYSGPRGRRNSGHTEFLG